MTTQDHAKQLIKNFIDKFNDPHYEALLMYAALPLIITPELLGYLRTKFLGDTVPWVAEADILLATDICQQQGYEQYVMNNEVRSLLLEKALAPDSGVNIQKAARLLLDYTLDRQHDPFFSLSEHQSQRLSAMVLLDDHREDAIAELIEQINHITQNVTPDEGDTSLKGELSRYIKLANTLTPALKDYPQITEWAKQSAQILHENPKAVTRVLPIQIAPPPPVEVIPDTSIEEVPEIEENSDIDEADLFDVILEGEEEWVGETPKSGIEFSLPDILPMSDTSPRPRSIPPITTLIIGLGGSGAWTLAHIKQQLYDIYDSYIPDNVALAVFDTSRDNIPSIGTQRNIREGGMSIGKTMLTERDYISLGGNAYPFARDIANSNHPHMQWFNANWFLSNLPASNFNLDLGTGMYRQFGRLAFFREVIAPNISGIASILDNRLRQLYREHPPFPSPTMNVFIVGSLVGGTGSGTFIDTAHIIQRVAEVNKIDININGFFYLPQAFKAVLRNTDLQVANVRAFAALRELSRFYLNRDYKYGYPMHYQDASANVNPDVWRSNNKGRLYNMVYLIDGEGDGVKMNNRTVKDGVAPAVADAIIAMIDGEYGRKYQEDVINIAYKQRGVSEYTSSMGMPVSSLGTFSVILPIQQIIEGWAYQFAGEMLNIIAPSEEGSDSLSIWHNPQFKAILPIEEVSGLLMEGAPMSDPSDPRRTITGLSLWGVLYEIYQQSLGNMNATLSELRAQHIGYWLSALVPLANQSDPIIQRAISETASIINERAADLLIPSNERKPKGDPSEDAIELATTGKRLIDRRLGVVTAGGGRSGGNYANALDKFIRLHVDRYKRYMTAYIFNELNGTRNKDELDAKMGRLAWVIAVCAEIKHVFSQAYETLSQVIHNAGANLMQGQRANIESQLMFAQREMMEQRDMRSLNPFRDTPAIKAQKEFINQVQTYIDFYRREITIEAILTIIKEFRDFTDKMASELNHWAKIITLDENSLYRRVDNGRAEVAQLRQDESRIHNHFVINDSNWESDRYRYYTFLREVRREFARAWQWSVGIRNTGTTDTFVIEASLNNQSFIRDMRGKWSDDNLNCLLEYCRIPFRFALSDVSLVEYLQTHTEFSSPEKFADLLHKNMSYLLAFKRDASTDIRNIVLAQHRDDPESQKYLQEVYHELGAKLGLGNLSSRGTTVTSADPFRLTVLSLVEMVNMRNTHAYEEGRRAYLNYPDDHRQLNHLFLAEINAVSYERRLVGELRQAKRLLQDKVVVMLENQEDLLNFLMLLSFGVIQEFTHEETGSGVRYYYAIKTPSQERHRQGQMDEWHLTDIVNSPKLIDAAIHYVLSGADYRNAQNIIPKAHSIDYLRLVQDSELETRINRDQLALNDAELRGWLETAFMPPLGDNGEEDLSNWTPEDDAAFIKVCGRIVIYDTLTDIAGYMREQLKKLEQRLITARNATEDANARMKDELHTQEEIDFYTVAILMLQDEASKVRSAVQLMWKSKIGRN